MPKAETTARAVRVAQPVRRYNWLTPALPGRARLTMPLTGWRSGKQRRAGLEYVGQTRVPTRASAWPPVYPR